MARVETPPGESALVASLLRLWVALQRLYRVMEQMFLYLLGTLRQLFFDMIFVIKAFLHELFLPTVSLVATALMLYFLMQTTMAYIELDNSQVWPSLALIGKILALLVGTLFALMVFVACKTPYRWGRVLNFYGEMLAWLLPNLMVFFLLMSVTLWMTSNVLKRNNVAELPYRMGIITGVLAGVMMIMLVVIVVRKRRLIRQPTEHDHAPVPVAAAVKAPEKKKRKWFSRPEGKRNWGKLGEVAEKAKRQAEVMGLDEKAARAREMAGGAAGFLKDRLKGKPLVVDKLDRAHERYQTKLAQVSSLSNMQAKVDSHTYDRLMGQYRGELQILKTELDQLMVEYRQTLSKRQEEMVGLQAESGIIEQRLKEIEALYEAGALNDADYKRERRTLDVQQQALSTKIEMCQSVLESMATEAAAQ